MKIEEFLNKYSKDLCHSNHTAFLSLKIFEKIKPYFKELENYDNKEDLALLENGAKLHDIGVSLEKTYELSHNKAGAKFILLNKPDEINEKELPILACLIRYHRKSLPSKKHKIYSSLSKEERKKVKCLGSIIKLADGMDYAHLELIEDFDVKFDEKEDILTFIFGYNIITNEKIRAKLKSKSDFFEKAYSIKTDFIKRG